MPQTRLTGSRIRERRLDRGLRQADLARTVGISPAYLNLIEHNRRRIGGKLLNDLARELSVEPASLAEGAEVALLGVLRAAAAREKQAGSEEARAEEFAGRFPGWAGLVAAQHRRIRELEHLVEGLSDRLTHDPHLAATLHSILTTVTAIHSTASILTDPGEVDPDWQARFLRNVGEDSARLARSAQGLVDYLDEAEEPDTGRISPQEELSAFLDANSWQFPALEAGEGAGTIELILEAAPDLRSDAARELARGFLDRYRGDAARLPEPRLRTLWETHRGDPCAVAAAAGTDLSTVLRRVAVTALAGGQGGAGLAVCDGSGTLTLRKPVRGFALPRFGAACPLWPLYQALARPAQPVVARVRMPGSETALFTCMAISQPAYPAGFAAPPIYEATMLIVPVSAAGGTPDGAPATPSLPVGSSCRICPRADCPARREPTILSGRV